MTNKLSKLIDLTGKKFGRWNVLSIAEIQTTKAIKWLCECECISKTKREVTGSSLKNGSSQSCGCLFNEKLIERITKHGDVRTRLYKIFRGMHQRCYYQKHKDYHSYGGRGITICDEWKEQEGYANFKVWALENGYADDLSIDRIDVNGIYEPSNCKWSTDIEQANNKNNNRLIEINGEVKTLAQWSEISGVHYVTIFSRIELGWNGVSLLIPSKKAEKQSGEVGVLWHKKSQKWHVTIDRKYIGESIFLEEAIKIKYNYINGTGSDLN